MLVLPGEALLSRNEEQMQLTIGIGRLGSKPEVKEVAGKLVATFRVATGRDKYTEWHTVQVWEKQAEFARDYLDKGRLIFFEGRNKTEQWEKDGHKFQKTIVNAYRLEGLDRPDKQGEEVLF